jgi:hypothetical protein
VKASFSMGNNTDLEEVQIHTPDTEGGMTIEAAPYGAKATPMGTDEWLARRRAQLLARPQYIVHASMDGISCINVVAHSRMEYAPLAVGLSSDLVTMDQLNAAIAAAMPQTPSPVSADSVVAGGMIVTAAAVEATKPISRKTLFAWLRK